MQLLKNIGRYLGFVGPQTKESRKLVRDGKMLYLKDDDGSLFRLAPYAIHDLPGGGWVESVFPDTEKWKYIGRPNSVPQHVREALAI